MSFLIGICVLGTLLFLIGCCFIYGRGGFRFSLFVITLIIFVVATIDGELNVSLFCGISALLQAALYRTFFIHGMCRSPHSPGLSRDRFEANSEPFAAKMVLKFWKVHLVFATVHSVVFIIQIVHSQKWYELIEAFGIIVIIYCMWLGIGMFVAQYYFLLMRHFAIKSKFVVSVPLKYRLSNVQLFGVRYWRRKNKQMMYCYAYENVFGDIYYRRLAKATDKPEYCNTALTRLFDRYQQPIQKRTRKLRVRYLIFALLIIPMTVLSFTANNTKEIKQYFNQSFLARDYVPKQGRVDNCEQVKRNSSRRMIPTTYSFYCEVTSLNDTQKQYFNFNSELSANLNRQIMIENGVVVYHDPRNITNSYILEDAESGLEDFYVSIFFAIILDGVVILCWVLLQRQIKANRNEKRIKKMFE